MLKNIEYLLQMLPKSNLIKYSKSYQRITQRLHVHKHIIFFKHRRDIHDSNFILLISQQKKF